MLETQHSISDTQHKWHSTKQCSAITECHYSEW